MIMIVKTVDQYLYELQRDVFVLELVRPPLDFKFDAEAEQAHLAWFKEVGVNYAQTVPQGAYGGKFDLYWVDFSGWDDPLIAAYTAKFENANGSSLQPDKYRMVAVNYREWVEAGGTERYEQHMRDLEDPDWNP
jgi:hypothetical protein